MTYTIVRRAFSEYVEIETGIEGWLVAMNRADELQYANRDGEYFVRQPGEPNQRFSSAYQSGLDWL